MPEATFWNLQFKEWIRLEWRFSRSLSWAQGISIVLNRYSLYSRFKGLISMEIISKATLITVLYRNERKVNRPSKLLDPEVAMTEGLLGDYNWVPNIYIFSLSFLPAPGGSSDSLFCIPDIYSPVFCWDSRHSYLVKKRTVPHFPDAIPSTGSLSEDTEGLHLALGKHMWLRCNSPNIYAGDAHGEWKADSFTVLPTLLPPCAHLRCLTLPRSLPVSYS